MRVRAERLLARKQYFKTVTFEEKQHQTCVAYPKVVNAVIVFPQADHRKSKFGLR
jgi:hypothetical protein